MPDSSDATLQPLAAYDPLSGIAWDTKLSGTTIGVYFYPAAQTVLSPNETASPDSYTTVAFNDYQLGRFQAALALFSNVTKLTFALAPSPQDAQLRFFQADFPPPKDESETLLGFAAPPGSSGVSGQAGFNSGAPGWSTAAGGTLEDGGNAFTTLIHEMGHAFGLAHPHDDGGGSSIFPGVVNKFTDAGTAGLNQGIFTMMSYRDGWADGPADFPARTLLYGEESTPMALDIAVLQQKYGANMTYRTGDDTYVLPDQNAVGTSYQAIWDAGGTNTIAYAGASNATIDLRPATLQYAPGGGGYVSYVQGIRGGFTIASGVTIRNAVSGSGDDLLTASDGGAVLSAGTGRNTIVGGAGNDTIISGGTDAITAGGGANLIVLGANSATIGSAGRDTILAGSGQTLVGVTSGGTDVVFGGGGGLTFVGGDGASTVAGGSGSATVFGGIGGGVLAGGRGGSNLMVAGTGAATLFGGGSGDVLFAQGANQVLSAGAGNETLSGGGATGGNVFFAGSGTNVVGGGNGSDAIFGGTGQATVFGGASADLFVFKQGNAGQVVIGDFSASSGDRLVLQGFGSGESSAAVAGAQTAAGGTTITLSDNTRITLVGVGTLQSSFFA